jgi:homocitrate synthase
MHTKAVLNDPASYEILVPEDFGRDREVLINHKLTGWNAVRARARQLAIELPDATIKALTQRIKELSDREAVDLDRIDRLLRDEAERVGAGGG